MLHRQYLPTRKRRKPYLGCRCALLLGTVSRRLNSCLSSLLKFFTVNGIRNPFQYQPWQSKKTFEGMFEILDADIVIFQETKIQRKDLRDDMVLVPGWDCYWSLPRHKKGKDGALPGLMKIPYVSQDIPALSYTRDSLFALQSAPKKA